MDQTRIPAVMIGCSTVNDRLLCGPKWSLWRWVVPVLVLA